MALVPLTAACVMAAAMVYDVPPLALMSVLKVEGGHLGEASVNKNKSEDLGPMQVNTVHIPEIIKATGGEYKAIYYRLRDDGCYNMFIATWLISELRRETKGDLAKALGNYHSRTPHLHQKYRGKLLREALDILNNGGGDAAR